MVWSAFASKAGQAETKAPISRRILAAVVDYVVLSLLFGMPTWMIIFRTIEGQIAIRDSMLGRNALTLIVLLFTMFPFCLRDIIRGRGFGKWLLSLRVVDAQDLESAPSVWQLILRNATNLLSPMGIAIAFFDPKGMRLGDRLAKTAVVREMPEPGTPTFFRTVFRVGACMLVVYVSFSVFRQLTISYAMGSEAHDVVCEYMARSSVLRGVARDVPFDAPMNDPDFQPPIRMVGALWLTSENPPVALLTYTYSEETGDSEKSWLSRSISSLMGEGPGGAFVQFQVTMQWEPGDQPGWSVGQVVISCNESGVRRFLAGTELDKVSRQTILSYKPLTDVAGALTEASGTDKSSPKTGTDQQPLSERVVSEPKEQGLRLKAVIFSQKESFLKYGYDHQTEKRVVVTEVTWHPSPTKKKSWVVADLEGYVGFTPEEQGAEPRVFLFQKSRGFGRFLTPEEVAQMSKSKTFSEWVSILMESDEKPK